MALHLPTGPLKTRSGLEPVLRCEPSLYQPTSLDEFSRSAMVYVWEIHLQSSFHHPHYTKQSSQLLVFSKGDGQVIPERCLTVSCCCHITGLRCHHYRTQVPAIVYLVATREHKYRPSSALNNNRAFLKAVQCLCHCGMSELWWLLHLFK